MTFVDQVCSKLFIYKDFADSPGDVEDVFRIDEDGGIAYNLREGTGAGADNRCSRCHCLERRHSEAFIKRRKDEGQRCRVENAQRVEGYETEEAHKGLHAGLDYHAANLGMLPHFVADDDEAKIFIDGVIFELVAEDGEGFDQTGDVLLRPDVAGIEEEGIADLVAVEGLLSFCLPGGKGGTARRGEMGVFEKAGIGCGIDLANAGVRDT